MTKPKIPRLYLELIVLAVIVGSFSIYKGYQFINWEQTFGEVVEVKHTGIKTFTGKVVTDAPVIRYLVHDKLYEKKATLLTNMSSLSPGDRVTIIYSAKHPESAYVFSLIGFWIPIPSIILIIFLFLIGIGFLNFLY